MPGLFDKVKAKAKETLSNNNANSTSSSSFPGSGQSNANHGSSTNLNFSKSHLQSQHPTIPQPGQQAPGPGQLPPKVAKHTYHDPIKFYDPNGRQHNVMRDLGFSGVLDGRIIWTWGDTLMGTSDNAMICAVDSTSIGTLDDKHSMQDSAMNGPNVRNWIDCNEAENRDDGLAKHAFGGTNIVEIAPGQGLVYYLKNYRPGGKPTIKGAGVATVTIDDNNVPHSQRVGDTLWNEYEPWYGDVGAVLNTQDGHIYTYGHGPSWDDELSSRTFLARAPASQATDINAYEYWRNGAREWTRQRQANGSFGTAKLSKEDALFDWHTMNQAAPFWSTYFNCWLFVHGSSWPATDVLCRSAAALEGPWTDHGSLCGTAPRGDEVGYRYCVTAHPEYDASGRTVYVTWTRENVIYGVTVEWA